MPLKTIFALAALVIFSGESLHGLTHDQLAAQALEFLQKGNWAQLDSLVGGERYAAYRLTQRSLEEYFQNADTLRLRFAENLANRIEALFSDSFWKRQCSLYKSWNQSDRNERAELLRVYSDSGEAIRSETLADRFLDLRDSSAAVKVLQQTASNLLGTSDDSAAIEFAASGLEVSRRIGDLDGEARSLNLMGTLHMSRAKFLKAGKYFDSARVQRVCLGDLKGTAECLNNIAGVYLELGENRRAYQFLQEALRLRRELSDSLQITNTLLNLMASYRKHRPLDELADWLHEAEEISRGFKLPLIRARLLQAGGYLSEEEGDHAAAQASFQEALTIAQSERNTRLQLSLLTDLASLHRSDGQFDSALSYYLRVETLADSSENAVASATTLHNIGALHQQLGDYETAIRFYSRSLEMRKALRQYSGMAETLTNLAESYLAVNDLESAAFYLGQAAALARDSEDRPLQASAYELQADIYRQEKDHRSASVALDSAEGIYEALGKRQSMFDLLLTRADLAREQGDQRGASGHLREAAKDVRSLSLRANLQRYELARGLLYRADKVYDSAYHYLASVVARQEETRRSIPEGSLRAGQKSRSRFIYEAMVAVLWGFHQANGEERYLDSIFYYTELAKSRVLLDLLANASLHDSDFAMNPLSLEECRLLRAIDVAEQAISESPEATPIDSLQLTLSTLYRKLSEVRMRLALAEPHRKDSYTPPRVGVREVSSKNPDERSAVLDYLLMPEQSLLLVFSDNMCRPFMLPSRERITKLLIPYFRLLQLSRNEENLIDSLKLMAKEVAEVVFGEFRGQLPKFNKLWISPDAVLTLLPFESLVVDGQYVVEFAAVSAVSSLSPFEFKESRPDIEKMRLLAIADPEFTGQMASLSHSRREVEEIASLFPRENSSILFGKNAVKTSLFSKQAASYDLIHIATHSFIHPDDPALSKIWLSPDSADQNGCLTLWEVMNLKLNADLVTLSSCESGGGRYYLGEGVDGFVRAFLYAGTDNVLVSLWEVEDFAGSIFMQEFYHNIEKGYAPALRAAKLKMLHSPRIRFHHPYYWSPYVLMHGK